MNKSESLQYKLLEQTIGISIKIQNNEFKQFSGGFDNNPNSFQKIVFQIQEEELDIYAVGVLFTLSWMSFTFAAPRGYSEKFFVPDEQFNLEYFVQGLEFRENQLCFSADYVKGRMMKTGIIFESGGKVKLSTRNRGKGAERWITHLQGKKHIKAVE